MTPKEKPGHKKPGYVTPENSALKHVGYKRGLLRMV
jgi:hypothetical protein